MCTVHTGPYNREQTAQCGVNHGGSSMIRETWIYNQKINQRIRFNVTCDCWIYLLLKTWWKPKTFVKPDWSFVSYPSLWANIVQKFASCMQSRESEQPRQSLQHLAASLHYKQPQPSRKWFSLNIENFLTPASYRHDPEQSIGRTENMICDLS